MRTQWNTFKKLGKPARNRGLLFLPLDLIHSTRHFYESSKLFHILVENMKSNTMFPSLCAVLCTILIYSDVAQGGGPAKGKIKPAVAYRSAKNGTGNINDHPLEAQESRPHGKRQAYSYSATQRPVSYSHSYDSGPQYYESNNPPQSYYHEYRSPPSSYNVNYNERPRSSSYHSPPQRQQHRSSYNNQDSNEHHDGDERSYGSDNNDYNDNDSYGDNDSNDYHQDGGHDDDYGHSPASYEHQGGNHGGQNANLEY